MWLILFHNWRPTFQAIFNLRTLRKLATWELILLTWCWLHSKVLMRMDHSDMKFKIHRATAPQRDHVAFAAKKEEENCIILFFFITSSFGIKEYSGYVINNRNHEESRPSHTHSLVTASRQRLLGAMAGACFREPWAYLDGKVKCPFCSSSFGDTVDFKYGLKNDTRGIFTWL